MFLWSIGIGHSIDRQHAWQLFGLTRKRRCRYQGATLSEIRSVLMAQESDLDFQWRTYKRISSRALRHQLLEQLSLGPTLMCYRAIAPNGVRAMHAVVAISGASNRIRCFDPLGNKACWP